MARILLDGVSAWMQGTPRDVALGLLAAGWYRGEPSLDTDGHELIESRDGWSLYSAYGEPILSWVYGDEWFSFDWSGYWGPDDDLDDESTSPAAIDRARQDFGVALQTALTPDPAVQQLSLI
ncbi:hypothetical protein H6F46_06810 [Limnothrix sp. FACHB-1083]|uniref:hypothetical protein n=1 Tax=unclassified Limnothrix TaxID=2632864 RepID=UPI001680B19B|nr:MULTISPECIES: hypothetical protein [unclassified Limnothrix]MBD2160403.1 hypothetical protein [Limnothrix sp. FACHB-1083]MBD2191104.1 hypothetical protein [Limnothrix sp. FACHB-1088]